MLDLMTGVSLESLALKTENITMKNKQYGLKLVRYAQVLH